MNVDIELKASGYLLLLINCCQMICCMTGSHPVNKNSQRIYQTDVC